MTGTGSYILEEGAFGARLVVQGPWTDGLLALALEKRVRDLYLNYARGWSGKSLAFLESLPQLQAFTVLDWSIEDVSPIHHLTDLRLLEVSTYCKTPINFASFPDLVDCRLSWRDGAGSLFSSGSLRRLFLTGFDRSGTEEFASLRQLESLGIADSAVKDLTGLSSLSMLRELTLAELRRLTSLAGIENLVSLERLQVNQCPRLESVDVVSALTELTRLEINDDGDIASLGPLRPLRKLEELFFYGSTNIVDGDLSPLADLPRLRKVFFKDRPHYSHKRAHVTRR